MCISLYGLGASTTLVETTKLAVWAHVDSTLHWYGIRLLPHLQRWWWVGWRCQATPHVVCKSTSSQLGMDTYILWRQKNRIGKQNIFVSKEDIKHRVLK